MESLKDALERAGERALQHRRRYPAQELPPASEDILSSVWQRLINEGTRLASAHVPAALLRGQLKETVVNMIHVVQTGLRVAKDMLHVLPATVRQSPAQGPPTKLCCGTGNPGRSGCLSVDGTRILWHRILNTQWSAETAIEKLGLHILGLPAARLPTDTVLPVNSNLRLLARGGPSYRSCAVLWKLNCGFEFAEIPHVGSDCRIWVSVRGGSCVVAFLCFVAMPTQGDRETEQAWQEELQGLHADLRYIKASVGPPATLEPKILLLGDWNVQPMCLGGGPDVRPSRDHGISQLCEAFQLACTNPSLAGDHARPVTLPLRGTRVLIRTGDTHHGPGLSRAIDLIFCSKSAGVETTVHNGIHCCQSSSCSWDFCADFCKSDHFLVEVQATVGELVDDPMPKDRCDRFPPQWHMATRWEEAFTHMQPAIEALSELVVSFREASEPSLGGVRRAAGTDSRRWVLDCLCWLQWLIGCVARDAWVHPCKPAGSGSSVSRISCLRPKCTPNVRDALKGFLQSSNLPYSATQKCFKLLRKPKTTLPQRMQKDGQFLSAAATQREWCRKLEDQCSGPSLPSEDMHAKMRSQVASLLGRAWSNRGRGTLDSDICEPEVYAVIASWKFSSALPPDLLPRAAFSCTHSAWRTLAWLLCQLAGPSRWALRPSLWRWASLGTTYKKGVVHDFSSWRLLFIKSQMGLLQEGILAIRLRPAVWGSLQNGQSGYMRGVDDPLLVLHDLAQITVHQNRCFYAVMGDFEKAFPSVWREDVLSLAAECPGVSGGVLHLLGDILDLDMVSVLLSGSSVVPVRQGLPEGGVLGPILYTLLPDSLAKVLLGHSCGLALSPKVPAAWANHSWSGQGTPQANWTDRIVTALQTGARLPSSSELLHRPDLEASAARALDILSAHKLAILLHADDPVILASSWGELARTLLIIERWTPLHGACFHVGPSKTVLFRVGGHGEICPILFRPKPRSSPVRLCLCASEHKWLGWLWSTDGGATESLHARLRAASSQLCVLAGLCIEAALPLPFAAALFESKVDGTLRVGRWLFAVMAPNAESELNTVQDKWARTLLGVPPWKPAHLASWELGWQLSGFARAVLDVASRRARIQSWPRQDWYRQMFCEASRSPASWAARSSKLLQDWGIRDFSEGNMSLGLRAYKSYVTDALRDACLEKTRKALIPSTAPCINNAFPSRMPRLTLQNIVRRPASWNTLLATRAISRLRLDLLVLGCRADKPSRAREVQCVCCERLTVAPLAHTLLRCAAWSSFRSPRQLWEHASLQEILCLEPEAEGFEQLACMALAIQEYVKSFWAARPGALRRMWP